MNEQRLKNIIKLKTKELKDLKKEISYNMDKNLPIDVMWENSVKLEGHVDGLKQALKIINNKIDID